MALWSATKLTYYCDKCGADFWEKPEVCPHCKDIEQMPLEPAPPSVGSSASLACQRPLFEAMLEGLYALRGEWDWKKDGAGQRNADHYKRLCEDIEAAEKVLAG